MSEIIDDLVVLGTAVPERVADGRRTVCMAGFSPSRGFIRIYPCRPDIGIRRWDILRLEVERSADSRHESWQIVNSGPEWESLNIHFETVGRINHDYDKRALITANLSPCVSLINEQKNSLGIIRASTIYEAYFKDNAQYGKPSQIELIKRPGEWAKPKEEFPVEPRLRYSCEQCKSSHDQKVLEWGAFEWMRKNPGNIEQYWQNALLYSLNHDIYLLVGNQILHRTSFLVINILPIKRQELIKVPRATQLAKQLDLF